MKLDIDFDSLDTYMSVYGDYVFFGDALKIYLQDGLGVPSSLRASFLRRYFYDPWSGRKYSSIKKIDGLLSACIENSDDWITYEDRSIGEEILKYEYVGGCWFVFEGVSFSVRKIEKYLDNRKEAGGGEVIEKFDFSKITDASMKEYFLEGVLEAPPGPGWMSWEINAKSFYIEIPDD